MSRPLLLFLLAVLMPAAAFGQALNKEQQLNQLKLKEQQLLLEQRRAALHSQEEEKNVTRELFDEGFIALQKYKQTLNRYQRAKLDYEKAAILLEETKLELLRNATRILVVEAHKYKSEEGKSMVDVVLENDSQIRNALMVDPSLTAEDVRTLLKVENIYVSLSNGPIVGEPYEILLPALEVGQRRTLTYRLLQEETVLRVDLSYLDVEESKAVILKKGGRQSLPEIDSAQFSQTAGLEQTARFDLTVEFLADEERSFALAAVGLPERIEYSFIDGGAKVNQVRFDEDQSEVKLQLQLEIPEKLDPRFIGRTRTFFALIVDPGNLAKINTTRAEYRDKPLGEDAVKALGVNYVKLELIPKGIGELEVLVANRYQELTLGDQIKLRVEFLNRGSAAVQNIKAALDLPYEWAEEVEPDLIKILEPGQRGTVQITATPPGDVAVGEYELGIEARGQVGNEDVESPEKNITIRLGTKSNLAGNALLIGVLLFLVVGFCLASIKISRR